MSKRLKAHREYVQAVEKRSLAIKTLEKTKAVKPKKVPLLKKKPEFDDACPINGKQYYGMTYLQIAKQKLHQKKRQLQMYVYRQARVIKGGVHVNLSKLGSIPFIGSTGESNSNQICQLTPDVIPSLKIRVPYFLSENFGNGYGAWGSGHCLGKMTNYCPDSKPHTHCPMPHPCRGGMPKLLS